jgi:hypothetical protein
VVTSGYRCSSVTLQPNFEIIRRPNSLNCKTDFRLLFIVFTELSLRWKEHDSRNICDYLHVYTATEPGIPQSNFIFHF